MISKTLRPALEHELIDFLVVCPLVRVEHQAVDPRQKVDYDDAVERHKEHDGVREPSLIFLLDIFSIVHEEHVVDRRKRVECPRDYQSVAVRADLIIDQLHDKHDGRSEEWQDIAEEAGLFARDFLEFDH